MLAFRFPLADEQYEETGPLPLFLSRIWERKRGWGGGEGSERPEPAQGGVLRVNGEMDGRAL